jgi:hypothetical protein
MSLTTRRLSAAQQILLAANDLAREGQDEFSEWQLTVAAWERNRNRFGLRGFEEKHPDHKRVMTEIMGRSKKDNPIRRQFIERTRTNCYRLTDLGKAEASLLSQNRSEEQSTAPSPGSIYAAIESYVDSRPFRVWLNDGDEPRSWLGAIAFLGLRSHTVNELNERTRAVETAVSQALLWCEWAGRDSITRETHGGSRSIPVSEIQKVRDFVALLKTRFARQIAAMRAKRRIQEHSSGSPRTTGKPFLAGGRYGSARKRRISTPDR